MTSHREFDANWIRDDLLPKLRERERELVDELERVRVACEALDPPSNGHSATPAATAAVTAALAFAPTSKGTARDRVVFAAREIGAPATFTAIHERTGGSSGAVRGTIAQLLKEGILRDVGAAETRAGGVTAGKKPRLYTLAQ